MRFLAVPGALLLAAAVSSQQTVTDPDTSYVFKVSRPSPALHAVLHRQFDVLHASPQHLGDLTVIVQPGAELASFRALAPNALLVERGRPFREIARERAAAAGGDLPPDPGYYTVAEIEQAIDAVVAAYPAIARKVDVTLLPGAVRTHGNRPIFALKVSDNVATAEDERSIVVAAQHHARELNSPHMVIGAMQRVTAGYSADPALRSLVDDSEIWFVPMVNPDGVDYVWNNDNNWRKNRRPNGGGSFGVDLNRNYPTLWAMCGSSSSTTSSTYHGPTAGSEPETQTMRALIVAERPEIYIDLHSSGREVLSTYAPCATASSAARTLVQRYTDDLRAPMSYSSRVPSASGEAPEDHWNESGTLSLLIEISTSFQPLFTDTIVEEARVWPGLRRALTAWQPAVRGHVRSVYQSQPIRAEIAVGGNLFAQGERTWSRARDGRYGLWLPLGSWQVTWTAPGFDPVTRTVQVSGYDTPQGIDIEMIPSWPSSTLARAGSGQVGTTVDLTYTSPGDAGRGYWIALSGATSPGFGIGSRTLPVRADDLFVLSLSAPGLIDHNLGVLSAAGQEVAQLHVPNIPGLAGVTIYSIGLTLESGYPLGVKKWSPALAITFLP